MATNPNTPGGTPPSPGTGAPQPSTAKPRATIVMKNPNAKPGVTGGPSAGGGPGGGGAPAMTPPASSPPRPPPARRPAANVQVDREALGLSAARPSEMIAGLDEAAKRAEALADREAAKRKSGGKLNANVAMHVDDTGKKWSLWVQAGLVLAFLVVCAIGGYMFYVGYLIRVPPVAPRVKVQDTKNALSDMEFAAKQMERFEADSTVTAPMAVDRLKKVMQAQLKTYVDSIKKDQDSNRTPDREQIRKRDELIRRIEFKDAWGKPFEFKIDGDDLAIRSTTAFDGAPTEPVKVRIRGSDKKTEKSEK